MVPALAGKFDRLSFTTVSVGGFLVFASYSSSHCLELFDGDVGLQLQPHGCDSAPHNTRSLSRFHCYLAARIDTGD